MDDGSQRCAVTPLPRSEEGMKYDVERDYRRRYG
jgi:hypothetical protein